MSHSAADSLFLPPAVPMSIEHDTLTARFERLVSLYGPALERLAGVYAADGDARDDLLQEIFLALWRALPSFRGESTERTFVYRVAHNRGLTHRARQHHHARLDDIAELPDVGGSPEQWTDLAIQHDNLVRAMRRLPLALVQALTLHLDGFSNLEAADVLGIRENAFAVRLSRARASLRAILATEDTR